MTQRVPDGTLPEAVRLDPRTLSAGDVAAWGDLADRALEPNPFLHPEFVLASVIERGIAAELLVILYGTLWIAALLVRTRRPSLRLPLPYVEALTDAYSFCSTPLIDRDAVAPAANGLIDAVIAERRGAALSLGMYPPEGPVADALAAAAAGRGMRPIVYSDYERAAWQSSPDPHFPGPRFNHSDRRELARRARHLAAELGGELEVVDRTNDPDAWEAFLAMEDSGWKAERGTALGSTPADAAFFRRMCAGMSAAGRLEVVALEVAGRTVAMECHLVDGSLFYSFKIAHDPAFRKFSPGTQLKYRVIDQLAERGLSLADSCAVPDNAHMNRLWPDRRRMQTLLLPTGAPSAKLLRPAMRARETARRIRDDIARRRTHPAHGLP